MGRISAVFKADGAETGQLYSISEWWLDPHTKGPGAHSHPEDDVFYVLAGTVSVMVGTEWIEARPGAFVLVPGNFEEHTPGIAKWFVERPLADSQV